ncbi:MAG: NAD(P)-binding domain-containing protein, partial [Candidatus Eisenbacteria bacterium]|nr:NAD(P)-binding domain-containing protein [Candidatus Eisenbacteria bacterium]
MASGARAAANGEKATFGVVGLGVMGSNLALNLHDHGETVAVWNVTSDLITRFTSENPGGGFVPNGDLGAFVASIERPRRILIMIRAGEPVDSVLGQLRGLLDPGDVVIDGGNSWYPDTIRRQEAIAPAGIEL